MTGASQKPFSQACENNWRPILDALTGVLETPGALLEIGSGTGQHAARIAPRLPHIVWHPSDLPDRLPGICAWLDDSPTANVRPPQVLDVAGRWPDTLFQYMFTANTFHILSREKVKCCITQAATRLCKGGLFCIYGPFRVAGEFTSTSNADFHRWLQAHQPTQGIRHLEWIDGLMVDAGLAQQQILAMPANNLLLVYQKGQ